MRFNAILVLTVLYFVCITFAAPLLESPTSAQDNTSPSITQRGIFHKCSVTFDQEYHVTAVTTVDSKVNDLAQQWVMRLLDVADKRMGLTFSCRTTFTNKYQGQLFAGNYHYPIRFHIEDEGNKPICGISSAGWGCTGSIRSDKSARFTHPYNEIQISRADGEVIFENSMVDFVLSTILFSCSSPVRFRQNRCWFDMDWSRGLVKW
ncbi:hypothetical protein J3R30DRAFT_3430143 [Lentinula aciculospora]|uniref:Uncharacterized protein n=1 Tax=Lentinula aciculospora TaxID=153920 RepID=A0A9W9APT2_9AGAR|nr:hypothetical protein J3R30DRAFT_3430143 [Lentinula aciculospora]